MSDRSGPAVGAVLQVGVHDLLRRPGSRQIVEAEVDVGGLSVSTARIPDGTKVSTTVTLDSVQEGVVLSATLDVPWTGDCRRCLEPTSGVVTVDVHEVYRVDPLEDMLPIENEMIDVGAAISDAALLSLPIAPLCSRDCPGPSPEQFPVGTADVAVGRPVDPRWAALDQLRFDSEGGTD